MTSREPRPSRPETWLAAAWMLIVRLAIVSAILYVLWRVRVIIVLVLLAAMLALSVAPAVDWLRRSRALAFLRPGYRRSVATFLVFLALSALMVLLGVLIYRPLESEIRLFAANWTEYRDRLAHYLRGLQDWYASLPADVQAWIEAQSPSDVGARVAGYIQGLARRTVESGMLLVELILIPVLAYSFLTESRPLKRELALVVPRSRLRDALYVLRQTGIILQSYALGQLILAAIAGVVVWALMVALGIRLPLVMAAIAAITRVIPVIGPIIGGIPIVLFSALQGWDRAAIVLVAFTLMHLVESKVVMPRVIGYRINLHPAVVIVVLLIGAEFFGMWGMFLAAPVAAVVKVMLQHFLVRPNARRRPSPPPAPVPVTQKETEVERPAVAGVRGHSGAH